MTSHAAEISQTSQLNGPGAGTNITYSCTCGWIGPSFTPGTYWAPKAHEIESVLTGHRLDHLEGKSESGGGEGPVIAGCHRGTTVARSRASLRALSSVRESSNG